MNEKRWNHLATLNQMRSNYQKAGNPLVNPSDDTTNVGNELSAFAYMDTPIPQPTKYQTNSEDSVYNGLIRTNETANEFLGNVVGGVLDFVDGIFDAAAYGTGWLFGKNKDWADKAIQYQWQDQVQQFLTTGIRTLTLSNYFTEEGRELVADSWSAIGNVEQSQKAIEEMHNASFTSELGEKGQEIYNTITTGIGSVLPSIIIGGAVGGATKLAQGISLGTMGLSSIGGGVEEALGEGAEYSQAGVSGLISGAIETASEMIPIPGLGGNRIGNIGKEFVGEAVENISEKFAKKTAKQIGKAMLEEGSEELISEFLSPLAQLPYKDFKDIEGASFEELALSFLGGAIGGAIGGGSEIAKLNTKYSRQGANSLVLATETGELIGEAQREFQRGSKANKEKLAKYRQQIDSNVRVLKEQFREIEASDKANGTNYYEKIVEVLKDPSALVTEMEKTIEQRESERVSEELRKISKGRNVEVNILSDEDYDNSVDPKGIGTRGYFTSKVTIDGKTVNQIVIRESKVDKFYELVAHEGISHGVIDMSTNDRNNLIKYIKGDKKLGKKWNETFEKVKKAYPNSSQDTLESETIASILEGYVTNASQLSKITDIGAKKGVLKLLNNLKKFVTQNNLDKKNRFIKQINKAIDNINKESVAFEPKLSYSKDTNKGETDYDFRKLQEESRGIFKQRSWKERIESFNGDLLERFSRIFRQEIHSWSSRNSNDNGLLNNTGDFKIYKNVDGVLFHDVFEIARTYLKNGELVDLHDNYNDSTCYLSDDGLSGFAITKNGDLISVFNLNYKKKGFLRAIAPFIKENAKTLDCYVLNNDHNLKWLYETMFGFKTASIMDYNMDYDHDDIAKNHNNPKVAFMVNTTKKVETKEFDKDSYDEAQAYQQLFISKDILYSKPLDSEVIDTTNKTKLQEREEQIPRGKLVKDRANLMQDRVINLNTTEDIVKSIKGYIKEDLGDNVASIEWDKDSTDRDLFERYNLYGFNSNISDKNVHEWVNDFFKSKIKFKGNNLITTDEEMTLSDFVKLTLNKNYNYDDYIDDFADKLKATLQAGSYETKRTLFKEFYRNKIDKLTNKVKYYQNATAYTIATYNKAQKLVERMNQSKIDLVIKSDGRVQATTNMFYEAIRKIKITKSSKGITPSSITNIVKAFDGYNEELFNNHKGEMLIEYNQDLKDIIDTLKSRFNADNKFPQRPLRLDELIMTNDLVGIINKTVRNLISEQAILQRTKNSQAVSNLKVVNAMGQYQGKDKLNFIERESVYATSFDIQFGKWFGYNSDIYDLFVTDIMNDHNNKLLQAHNFLSQFRALKEKYNLQEGKLKDSPLNKKIQVKDKDGKVHTMTYQNAVEIYAISQTDNGLETLLDGGYSFKLDGQSLSHTLKFDDKALEEISNMLPQNMKDFGLEVLDLYNNELKDYKAKADNKIYGTTRLMESTYYPLNKSDVSSDKLTDDQIKITSLDPTKTSNVQESKNMHWKAVDGVGIEKRFIAYVDALTNYGETYESRLRLQNFTKSWSDGKSHNQWLKETIPEWSRWYTQFYEKLIVGESLSGANIADSKLFNNVVSATLYGNASVILKQTASIPTILNEVSLKAWAKGLAKGFSKLKDYKGNVSKLMSESGILAERWTNNDPIKAQTLQKEVGKIAKLFGIPMEFTDQAVIVLFAYTSAEYEAEIRGFTRGTKEFDNEVINILNRIVLNTQSNAEALKMSPNRAGVTGEFRRVLSVFSSDLQNKFNYLVQMTAGYNNAKKRIKYLENRIAQIKTNLQEQTLSDEEKFNLEKEIKSLEKMLEGDKVFISKQPERVAKLLVTLLLSALMIAGIEQFVSRLLGRKEWNWNEKDTDEFVKTLVIEGTIGNIPYVNQVINALDYDQDLGAYSFTAINELLDSYKKISKMIQEGNMNYANLAYELTSTLGYFTGIPFKNLYNIVTGIIKNVSPNGYKVDNYIKNYSEQYVYTAFKESINDGNYKMAKGNLDLLLSTYKGGKVSDEVLNEMFRLAKLGYNVTPTTNLTEYENEKGEMVRLTDKEKKAFQDVYNQATVKVNELLNISSYRSLSDEDKAKVIKRIYSAYYYYAKAKALNEIPENKLAQLLYYSNGNIDLAKYISTLQEISNTIATGNKTKKQIVLEKLNKVNLSKNEKFLILYLSGYKLNEENKLSLENYLQTKGIKKNSLAF